MGNLRFVEFMIILSFTVLNIPPIYAQFSNNKIEDDYSFELEKPLEFYSNTRYNRVEGLFLNFGLKLRPQSMPKLQIYGDAGWGFDNQSDKKFRYAVGIRKDLFAIKRLSLGAEIFKKVESQDDWIIGDVENSLAAFFFREDFKDYYGAQGFKIYLDHRFLGIHTIRFEVGHRTFDALRKNTNWSVFGGDKDFEENPAKNEAFIAEGDEIGLKLIAAFDWRDNPIFPLSGWYLESIYERTFEDFNTDGLFLSIKRFQQMYGNQRLFIRFLIGTRHGSSAEQYTMDIGGFGSLRGFDDKEFSGNRMVMLNANYLFGGDVLQKIPLHRLPVFGVLWSVLSFGIFLDTGWAWTTDPEDGLFDGFGQLTLDKLKTDLGFSILVLDGVFRMDVAKRTERSNDDFRITFRLLEKF
ncbi:MAG: hypothetical protein ACE5JB_01385 [bacterium]